MLTTATSNQVSFPKKFDPTLVCPNCRSAGLSLFYGINQIPVHSCLLMPSPEHAVQYPRGNLSLAHCAACGFITNTQFNLADNEYSTSYEETQGFSPTFNSFARQLAQRWIDRYNLHDKHLLEIGCGKGEFLALLCELGPNSGIGIDPAYVPGRLNSPALGRMKFLQELYSEKHSHLKADFITCRHSLEHIAPTRQFMEIIRRTIGSQPDVTVAFDLPDVLRVLKEGAFWDIYYEHCSYFSAGSLARLFRASGFDVTELERDYDDQYLVIGSRPVDGPTPPRLPLENDLQEIAGAVAAFPTICAAIIKRWRDTIDDMVARNKKVVLWGSGSKGVAFIQTLGIAAEVPYVVDINPFRHGKFMPGSGHPIVSPAAMADYRPDCVIIMNPIYTDEIGRDLRKIGLKPELLPAV